MNPSTDKILAALQSGEALKLSNEELQELRQLFTTENGRRAVQRWIDSQACTDSLGDVDFRELYDTIRERLDLPAASSAALAQRHPRGLITAFQRVAAVLFIPLLVGLGYVAFRSSSKVDAFQEFGHSIASYKEYYSPAGSRLRVILQDSTEVWLNGNSRLKVSDSYGVTDRHVELVGEGNFNVHRNESLSFIVSAGKMKVKALGTVFNINAYPEMPEVEAVLISGKVEVQADNAKKSEVVSLAPNQRATFSNSSSSLKVTAVNTQRYVAWPEGRLVFDNKPLGEVAQILEKWFNVNIVITDAEVKNMHFTAQLGQCSVEQILKYISYTAPIAYTIKNENITIRMIK